MINPISDSEVVRLRICHQNFNLDRMHNLDEIPEGPAVFGIFGAIHNYPVHARIIASTQNLRREIYGLFEKPSVPGLMAFMQGSWIHILCYHSCQGLAQEEMRQKERHWIECYKPSVTSEGEYPEYTFIWSSDQS